jgi:hypothetical protein
VRASRAAPAAVGLCVVGRAQVGGRDGDAVAGFAVLAAGACYVALDGVALAAGRAVVEQRLAQRRVVDAVPGVVEVVVPAGTTYI